MKKIVLLLATLSICLWAGAQEHLKFKNVSIDGPKKAFLAELRCGADSPERPPTPLS